MSKCLSRRVKRCNSQCSSPSCSSLLIVLSLPQPQIISGRLSLTSYIVLKPQTHFAIVYHSELITCVVAEQMSIVGGFSCCVTNTICHFWLPNHRSSSLWFKPTLAHSAQRLTWKLCVQRSAGGKMSSGMRRLRCIAPFVNVALLQERIHFPHLSFGTIPASINICLIFSCDLPGVCAAKHVRMKHLSYSSPFSRKTLFSGRRKTNGPIVELMDFSADWL